MTPESTEMSLSEYCSLWSKEKTALLWEPLFMLPPWLKSWVSSFHPDGNPMVVKICDKNGLIIGLLPLLLDGSRARIIGSENVCDYVDMLSIPGHEEAVAQGILRYFKGKDIGIFDAGVIRHDSLINKYLTKVSKQEGFLVQTEPDEVSPEKVLPETWEEYLQTLDTKQRHELRRKFRRLDKEGTVNLRIVTQPDETQEFIDIFLKMFVESREDKAEFLTPMMEIYFRNLVRDTAANGLLRAAILELDDKPRAAVMAFDHHGQIYLYNSGFDINYKNLSVGIISKALLIKDSIESGKRIFNFLKGPEHYKYHLGGSPVQLIKYRITGN